MTSKARDGYVMRTFIPFSGVDKAGVTELFLIVRALGGRKEHSSSVVRGRVWQREEPEGQAHVHMAEAEHRGS